MLLCTLQASARAIVVRLSNSRYDPAAFAMEHNGDMLATRRREALLRSSRVPPGLTSRPRVPRGNFNNDERAVRRRELAQRRDRMAAQRARALRDRAALFGERVDGSGRGGGTGRGGSGTGGGDASGAAPALLSSSGVRHESTASERRHSEGDADRGHGLQGAMAARQRLLERKRDQLRLARAHRAEQRNARISQRQADKHDRASDEPSRGARTRSPQPASGIGDAAAQPTSPEAAVGRASSTAQLKEHVSRLRTCETGAAARAVLREMHALLMAAGGSEDGTLRASIISTCKDRRAAMGASEWNVDTAVALKAVLLAWAPAPS